MELKLRAWAGGRMVYRGIHDRNWYATPYKGGCHFVGGAHPDDRYNYKTMLSIGRQDIHKTDIYSGDKVKFLDIDKIEHTGIVKFKSCSFYIDCGGGYNFYRWMDYSSFEIIGSIHEK